MDDKDRLLIFQTRALPPWRKKLVLLTYHWAFRGIIYMSILFAAGQLAWPYVNWPNWNTTTQKDPTDPTISLNAASDGAVLVIFILEALLKMLAFGIGINFSKKKEQDSDSEASIVADKLKQDEEDAILSIFNLFDVDRSGSMSELELRLALRGLGFDETTENVRRLFQEMDSDRNNEIDFLEFKEVMASKILSQPKPPGYFRTFWNQFDFIILFISCIVFPIQFFQQDAKKVGDIARLLRLARLWGLFDTPRLRVMKDILRVLTLSIWRSVYICSLISAVLIIFATMGVDLFSDGQLHARCLVAPNNSLAARWDPASAAAAGRTSTVGLLQQPERHCGYIPCDEGFVCSCEEGARESAAAAGHSEWTWSLENRGCGMIPIGQLGQRSGTRPVTLDFGFLGFDNVLQGSLTAFVGITMSRWTRALEAIQYSYYPAGGFCFFICLFTFGRLWVANLFVACVSTSYTDVTAERRAADRHRAGALAEARVVERLKYRAARELAQSGGGGGGGGGGGMPPAAAAAMAAAATPPSAGGGGLKRMLRTASIKLEGPPVRKRTPSVVMSLGTAASQAMLERLGDLQSANPRDLAARIQGAFARFDPRRTGMVPVESLLTLDVGEDSHGERVGVDFADSGVRAAAKRGELHNLLRTVGVQLTTEEEEYVWNRARKNDDGQIDEDEFEELVKAVIAKVRREAREAEQAAWEFDEEGRKVRVLGLFWVNHTYLEPNTIPLSGLALLAAKSVALPHQLDECGERIPGHIVYQAKLRNLIVTFGPGAGQWKLRAGNGGASMGINRRSDRKSRPGPGPTLKELFPSDQPIPGGHGVSNDLSRKDLETFLMEFDMHSRFLNENGEILPSFAKPPNDGAAPYAEILALGCITCSSVLMCCVHYEGLVDVNCTDATRCPEQLRIVSDGWDTSFAAFEYSFNGIFTLEAILKIWGGGFLRYIVVGKNQFDFVVVCICDLGLIMWSIGSSRSQISFIRLIRIVRMLQLFRMVNGFRFVESLLQKFKSGLKNQIPIIFTFMFTLTAAAIIGMRMFPCIPAPNPGACKLLGSCEPLDPVNTSLAAADSACLRSALCPVYTTCPFDPVYNFDSFSDAFRVVFIVAMTQGWEELMLRGMRMYDSAVYSLFFFLLTFAFFNYYVTSIFVAAGLESFRTSDDEKERQQVVEFKRSTSRLLEADGTNDDLSPPDDAPAAATYDSLASFVGRDDKETSGSLLWFANRQALLWQEAAAARARQAGGVVLGYLAPPMPDALHPDASRNVRGLVRDLLRSAWWENCVFSAIVLSSLQLSLQSPIDEFSAVVSLNRQIGSSLSDTITLFCFSVFLVEMVLKMLENGFFWENDKSYFRLTWNIVDFTIILAFALELGGLSYVTVIRILRSLRLTRLVRFGPVVLLQEVLSSAMWDLRLVLLMMTFVFSVMAIMAQSFFFGALNFCTDSDQGLRVTHLSAFCDTRQPGCDPVFGRWRAPQVNSRVECTGVYFNYRNSDDDHFVTVGDYTEIMRPRVWSNPTFSFDNFGTSMQTLIEVFSLDEWVLIASSAEGFRGIGINPIPKEEASVWLYFIFFVMFTRLSILPVFLGVLVNHLSKVQGTAMSTSLQENWRRFQAKLDQTEPFRPPKPPSSPLRRRIFLIVEDVRFIRLSDVVLLINTAILAANYNSVDPTWALIAFWINVALVAFYATEMILKLIAYGLTFFEEPWNLFDFGVVCIGILELCDLPGLGFRAVLLFRVIRSFRIVRFLRRLTRLQLLLSIISNSSRLITGCFLLLAVFVFFFAVIGCQFLAGVRYGRRISRTFNFDTTLNAFAVLFVIATGDGFGAVVREAGIAEPSCTRCDSCKSGLDPDVLIDFSDCGTPGAQVFLDIYLLVASTIFLQLLVAVILDMYYSAVAETRFVLQGHHLESFCRRWQELDPQGTGRISVWCLRTLLERLHLDDNPMGSCALSDEFNHRSIRLEIIGNEENAKFFEFRRTIRTLSLRVAGDRALPYADMMRRREHLAFFAQAAVLSKAAILYGRQKHLHDLQTNLLRDQERDEADHHGHSARRPALGAARSTFCFALSGGERLLVVDSASGYCFIRAAPGTALPLVQTWPASAPPSNRGTSSMMGQVPSSPAAGQGVGPSAAFASVRASAVASVSRNSTSSVAVSFAPMAGGAATGAKDGPEPEVDESVETELLDSWYLSDVVTLGATFEPRDDGQAPDGVDSPLVRLCGADGAQRELEFCDVDQARRFFTVAKHVQIMLGDVHGEFLQDMFDHQVRLGMQRERDSVDCFAMRYVLGATAPEVQRCIQQVGDRFKKFD